MSKAIFRRTELLLGKDGMENIASKKVIIFGIGGVGSWCAESLIRNGVSNLTIVDSDRVCITNVNRQLMATTKTVGMVKTDALKERLLEINPSANIIAIQKIYSEENSGFFDLGSYDYIIDAIDSLGNKIHLINNATRTNAVLYSSMGASLRLDPTQIKVANFWDVKGCHLGRIMRKKMRHRKQLPAKDFLCVYSEELLENKGPQELTCGNSSCVCPKSNNGPGDAELVNHEWCSKKAAINGTSSHITAIFGFTLAGLVTQHIVDEAELRKEMMAN